MENRCRYTRVNRMQIGFPDLSATANIHHNPCNPS